MALIGQLPSEWVKRMRDDLEKLGSDVMVRIGCFLEGAAARRFQYWTGYILTQRQFTQLREAHVQYRRLQVARERTFAQPADGVVTGGRGGSSKRKQSGHLQRPAAKKQKDEQQDGDKQPGKGDDDDLSDVEPAEGDEDRQSEDQQSEDQQSDG